MPGHVSEIMFAARICAKGEITSLGAGMSIKN